MGHDLVVWKIEKIEEVLDDWVEGEEYFYRPIDVESWSTNPYTRTVPKSLIHLFLTVMHGY